MCGVGRMGLFSLAEWTVGDAPRQRIHGPFDLRRFKRVLRAILIFSIDKFGVPCYDVIYLLFRRYLYFALKAGSPLGGSLAGRLCVLT